MSKASDSDQTPRARLPQLMGNSTLHDGIQFIDQRAREIFSNLPRRSLPEEDAVHNMPRNNDEDEDDDINVPNNRPPLAGPIYRTFEGNVTKYDNSSRKTNISSCNAEGNTINNSFNENPHVGSGSESSRTWNCQCVSFLAYYRESWLDIISSFRWRREATNKWFRTKTIA